MTELGLWLLELESHFGRSATVTADADLALSERPTRLRLACQLEACTRNANASVRFSFQGPREPGAPCRGPVKLVCRDGVVKSVLVFGEFFWSTSPRTGQFGWAPTQRNPTRGRRIAHQPVALEL